MKIKKTHLLSLFLALFLAAGILYTSIKINAADSSKHYVTAVTPASYTDIVEFYGNSFVIDNTQTALCVERDKGTPYPGVEVTLSYYDNSYINKILYYGYNGPAEWAGFYNDDHAILCTSMMLSDAYSNCGYKDICDEFKEYLNSAPDAPEFSLRFSPEENYAYPEGDIQRTGDITLMGDNRLSVTLTLEEDMEIHFKDGTVKTGNVTIKGGDIFYISSNKSKSDFWYSGELFINETSYSTILAVTASSSMQDLMYLTPDSPKASGSFSVNWYNKGELEIIKSSSSIISENNGNYSLEGAIFKLYKTYSDAQNDINPVCTLTTDKTGYAKASELDSGEYYLKEISPPKGYIISSEITSVKISSQTTTKKQMDNTPMLVPISVILQKQGSDGKLLENAQFQIKYYKDISESDPALDGISPEKSWIIKTDSNGYACLDYEHLISGDDFYIFNNETVLPLGTITIEELEAPTGYEKDNSVRVIPISPTSYESLDSYYNPPIILNNLITSPFQIIKYGESYQGSTPLSGAGFMACPVSQLERDLEGNYIWDDSKAIALTKEGELELFTNQEGYALSAPLPYGTYMVRETTVPVNYYPVEDFYVTISSPSDIPQEMIYITDECFKAYIKIFKEDANSNALILNNSSTFKIWSYSEECYISFNVTENGETFIIDEFQTNSDGTLITPEPLFPGKYLIEEIVPPDGYAILSSSTGYVVEISNQNECDYLTDSQSNNAKIGVFTVNIPNAPITGEIEIVKEGQLLYEAKDSVDNYIPLKGIIFNIYAAEDIYSPDGQGTLLYSQNDLVESIITDEYGRAISSNSLPLGTYTIQEVNTPEQYVEAVPFQVTISKDNTLKEVLTDNHTLVVSSYFFNIKNYLKSPDIPSTESTSEEFQENITESTTESITESTPTVVESITDTVPKTGDSLKPFSLTIICIATIFFITILIFHKEK